MDPSNNKNSYHYCALEAQLAIGLKFHFPETLKKLPLEVALRAMEKVWKSCQDNDDDLDEDEKIIYL